MSALDLIGRTPIVELRNLGGHTSFEKLPNRNLFTEQFLLARRRWHYSEPFRRRVKSVSCRG